MTISGRRRILLAEIVAKVPQPSMPATWNPSDKAAAIALSGGNLVATKSTTGADWACVRATVPMIAGQWYWETTVAFTGTADFAVGCLWYSGTAGWLLTSDPGFADVGRPAGVAVSKSGTVRSGGNVIGSLGAISTGRVVRHWLDMDAQLYCMAVDGGAWVTLAVPETWWSWPDITIRPVGGVNRPVGTTGSVTGNFGATSFAYPVPDGANAGVYTVPDAVPISIYLSSEAIATDTMQYDARIAGDDSADVEIERAGSCYVWGSQSVSRRGKLVAINADGALDVWASYEWRDAVVTLRSGYDGDAVAAFTTWSVNRVDSIASTDSLRVELTLADPLALLDRALQTALYPDDQPNAQLAGKPVPIVYGAPMYCTAARLDTSDLVRDFQLHDAVGVPLLRIDGIYDGGDLFAGPDDPFIPHDAITAANGGDFTNWAGTTTVPSATPAMPANWTALTPFTGGDRFLHETGVGPTRIGLRALSAHNPLTAMQHSEVLHARTRYQLTFTTATINTPGILTFAAGNVTVPFSAVAPGGAQSIVIDVAAAAKLELRLNGTPLQITVRNLRATAVQIIDWTYYSISHNPVGFTLTNVAAKKVVANPVSELHSLVDIVNDVCSTRLALPDAGALPAVDNSSLLATNAGYILAKYIDTPVTALVFLRELLDSHCGWVTSNRLGQIAFGRVTAPSNTAVLTLDETNILGEITVSDDLAKGLTLRQSGRRNNSPHAPGDIADSVSPAMRAELQTEMTLTRVGAPLLGATAVSAAYMHAVAAPARPTLLQLGNDLQREANRVATLWRPVRKFYQLTALLDASAADALEPGQTVRVVWPRYGLDAGRNLLLVGLPSRFFARRVNFTLWG